MDIQVFAKRLKDLRNNKGLSARQLALQTGLSKFAITSWESCTRWPTAESIYKLAVFFSVTAGYLLGLEN